MPSGGSMPADTIAFSPTANCCTAGCGITFPERSLSQRWFHTTVPYTEPTYTFSGNFGGQLEGRGVGLPMAALHARLYGGDVSLDGLPGDGCTAHVYLAADAKIG